jgi:hypothetical protein
MSARGCLSVYRRSGLFDGAAHTRLAMLAQIRLQAPEIMQARLP